MKNKFLIIGALVLIIIGVVIFFFFNNTSQNGTTSNYSANRTEAEINNNEASNTNSQDNAIARHNTEPIETEISSFSTPIMTQDANRQNNVELTCSSLNDTIVENGQTFSFCETLGPATTSEGYKKAEVFDAQRK
ncbi:MAG: VanW family protein [Clostridia bacterium]|nr:VanW family protein [Clostridia bacterium]